MKRRTFVQATAATILAGSGIASSQEKSSPEFYELRTYTLKQAKLPLLDAYLKSAFIPAVKAAGAGPVGVFLETESSDRDVQTGKQVPITVDKELARLHVLVVHPNAESALKLPAKLKANEVYGKAASEFLAIKPSDPIVQNLETAHFEAIAGMPKLIKPDSSRPRLLNLRTYASHNDRSAAKKIEMFEKGELEIFKRVGLTPVFFAAARSGELMPNLTYLLVFPDDSGRSGAWKKFGSDSEWLKLRAIPEYADKELLTRIINRILVPREYSEI